MLNAQWLNTFVVLCETGHFTKAAAQLNMTQPGVSQQLRKLELQLGRPLITQDGKSFTLTPSGEAVLDFAKKRRDDENELLDVLEGDDPGHGQVTIACSGSLAMLIYPRIVSLMQIHTGLRVQLEAAPQGRVLEGVLSGVFDIGVADHEPSNQRLESDFVGTDELCLLLPKAHVRHPAYNDLEALGFIAHPDGFAYADELLSANFPKEYQGIERLRIRSFINQISQIPQPVAEGVGYTILPRSGVDSYSRREEVTIAVLEKSVRHDLWLVRRKGRVLAARVNRIMAEVAEVVGQLTETSSPADL